MPVNLQSPRILAFYKSVFSIRLCALSIFISIFSTICFAQKDKIDSLKKILPPLHDSARIDYLNAICFGNILFKKKDAALYYVNEAYEETKRLDYIHGLAVSFSRKSQMAKHFDDDFIRSNSLGKESLR